MFPNNHSIKSEDIKELANALSKGKLLPDALLESFNPLEECSDAFLPNPSNKAILSFRGQEIAQYIKNFNTWVVKDKYSSEISNIANQNTVSLTQYSAYLEYKTNTILGQYFLHNSPKPFEHPSEHDFNEGKAVMSSQILMAQKYFSMADKCLEQLFPEEIKVLQQYDIGKQISDNITKSNIYNSDISHIVTNSIAELIPSIENDSFVPPELNKENIDHSL